jgi:hypothetical protein
MRSLARARGPGYGIGICRSTRGRVGNRRAQRPRGAGAERLEAAQVSAAYACGVTADELRSLVAALPDGDGLLRVPRGYAVRARPTALGAAAAGTDLQTLDAWVIARRGQLRTARVRASTGSRRGRRADPPPAAPQRFYIVPSDALSA